MAIVPGMQSALAGLQRSLEHFERTAQRLSVAIPDGDPVREIVGLMVDSHSFRANLVTVRAADEMIGSLLDVLR